VSEQSNVEVVQATYEAFSRGDIPAVLARIDDSMVFTIYGSPAVPLSGVRRGVAGVTQFFAELAKTLEFSAFEPHDYIAQSDRVVALVHYAGKNRNTGRNFDAETAMVWTVRGGKLVKFIEYTDTELFAKIAQPAAAGAH
jgi:ketosteroid isomerase-like protein